MEKVSASLSSSSSTSSSSSSHQELTSAAMKELSKGLKLLAQLQTLLLPFLPESNQLNLANNLFQDTFSSLSLSLSILQSSSHHLPPEHMNKFHQDRCDLNYNLSGHHYKRKRKDAIATVTSKPFFDGYQWKKYGQKKIKNSMFQRTYYKCINGACKATKTVQQKDQCDPPNFMVTYGMQHTCNVAEINQLEFIMDSSTPTQTFVPIIESNSFMMNKQQEQTSSSTSDQFQCYYNSSEETTVTAQALPVDDSATDQVSSDNIPKIFSPSCDLYYNYEENESAWMMEEGIRSSSHEFNSFGWDGFLF